MSTFLLAMAQVEDGGGGGLGAALGLGFTLVMLAITVLFVAAFWKVFSKAGEPGWASLVPIYNAIVLLRIAGKPAWWFVLMLLPVINFVIIILVSIALAQSFGKSTGFGLGLAFLGPIFFPMLAFGDARYQGAPA
jgi:hypothetical protein